MNDGRKSFTLVELIFVISIISILVPLGFSSYTNTRRNSHAAKIATDLQQIKLAWATWKNTNDIAYPRDSLYPRTSPLACETKPVLSQTPAALYLQKAYTDPWNIEYLYDNDGDTIAVGTPLGGVNIYVQWCSPNSERYLELAPIIDRSLDNGDGATNGFLRWGVDANGNGAIVYLLANNENQ